METVELKSELSEAMNALEELASDFEKKSQQHSDALINCERLESSLKLEVSNLTMLKDQYDTQRNNYRAHVTTCDEFHRKMIGDLVI